MLIRGILNPVQRSIKRLGAQYGASLVFVRDRYDEARRKRRHWAMSCERWRKRRKASVTKPEATARARATRGRKHLTENRYEAFCFAGARESWA